MGESKPKGRFRARRALAARKLWEILALCSAVMIGGWGSGGRFSLFIFLETLEDGGGGH